MGAMQRPSAVSRDPTAFPYMLLLKVNTTYAKEVRQSPNSPGFSPKSKIGLYTFISHPPLGRSCLVDALSTCLETHNVALFSYLSFPNRTQRLRC